MLWQLLNAINSKVLVTYEMCKVISLILIFFTTRFGIKVFLVNNNTPLLSNLF